MPTGHYDRTKSKKRKYTRRVVAQSTTTNGSLSKEQKDLNLRLLKQKRAETHQELQEIDNLIEAMKK